MKTKHTGTHTGSMFYSERAIRRKQKENKKFQKNYNSKCGKCTTTIVSKEEMAKILNELGV